MLSGLLDTIKSQFTSKSYWLGSMVPLLLFLFANGILVHRHAPHLMAWITSVQNLATAAFEYSLILVVLLATAYLLSILSSPMLQILEGQHLPVLSIFLRRAQWSAVTRIDQEYRATDKELKRIEKERASWEEKLQNARKEGTKNKIRSSWKEWNVFRIQNLTKGGATTSGRRMRWRLARVRFCMRYGCRLGAELLEKTVKDVSPYLAEYDATTNSDHTVDAAHTDLLDAIQYALDRTQFDRLRLLNYRQFHYPGSRPSAPESEDAPSTHRILAPTRMGNIGRTMRSYGLTRYQLDLDIFWTRLQSALQKDGSAYFTSLQDIRAQVDCMVSLVWLSAIFTLTWTLALLFVFKDSTKIEFQVVGTAGAVATIVAYLLACQSYRTFADVIRSCIDLFRLKMLDAFNLQAPYGYEEEREVWRRLGNVVGYGAHEQFKYKGQ